MSAPAVIFLMYHELALPNRSCCQSEPGYVRYVLSAEEFEAQMLTMKASGLRGVKVSEALKSPSSAVAITFDDGCETDLLAAAPILKRLGFGATFYIVPGRIGQTGYMNRAQLCQLSEAGFEIGCHSMTHPYLPDLDDARLHHEIAEAKTKLEQMTGKPVEHFSCPGGRYDARVIQIAKAARYHTLSTSRPRANSASADPFCLGRIAISRGLSTKSFQKLCRGESLWKLQLRVSLRDGAKRLLGNDTYDQVRTAILGR